MHVRYRWGQNDLALWDNRCTFHAATNDYGHEAREGTRFVGLGEVPYFDVKSVGRREGLAREEAAAAKAKAEGEAVADA
jgi:hypothetical protein